MIKAKLSESLLFNEYTREELLIMNEMINWQIDELQALWWELNKEQSKIMMRFHELEARQEQELQS